MEILYVILGLVCLVALVFVLLYYFTHSGGGY